MEKKYKKQVFALGLLGLISALSLTRKSTKPTNPVKTGTATIGESGTGGGGPVYNPPVVGFVISGVGQIVTGLTVPQNVTAPARVINLTATPAGIYSGTATLKTLSGTVLHTETITDLNISPSGAGAYPAIYFNPTNPVWNIPGAGTYVMQVVLTIQNVVYTRTVEIAVTNTDLGITGGGGGSGTSGVSILDYSVSNGNQVVLSLSGGTVGTNVTILLKQGNTTTGTLTAPYAASMTVQSSAFGYLDVFVDNTDLGGVYLPYQLTGSWTVEKAKAVDENGVLDLTFAKMGTSYVVVDNVNNDGWANVEYWHNATFLGSSIPANYSVEPLTDHHITKKRWGNFFWLGYDADGLNRQLAQITFKIVAQ